MTRKAAFVVTLLLAFTRPGAAAEDLYNQDVRDGFSQIEAIALMVGEYEGPVHVMIAEIDATNFGYWSTYAEFRLGGRTAPVSRQRVFAHGWQVDILDDEETASTPLIQSFDIPDDRKANYVGGAENPDLLKDIVRSDFIPFPFECILKGKREGDVVSFGVSAESCVIDNPELGPRRVTLEFTFRPDGMTIYEVGFDMDGNKIFGTDEPLFLARVSN